MKKNLFIFGVVLSIVLSAVWFGRTEPKVMKSVAVHNPSYKHTDIIVNGQTFDGLISDTEVLRNQGLSGFKSLALNEVMLFIFDKADSVGFWMKDMLFSLDMVWLDGDMKVVSIEKNISPDTFPKIFYPQNPAVYVLEFASGTTARLGTKIGDTIFIGSGK